MQHQVLWLQALLAVACALPLLLFPATLIRLLGLPSAHSFWPRMLGAVLIGMAAALLTQGRIPHKAGLGHAGVAIVNLVVATALAVLLILRAGLPSRRARLVIATLMSVLYLLAFVALGNTD